jgi:hypothetical protein
MMCLTLAAIISSGMAGAMPDEAVPGRFPGSLTRPRHQPGPNPADHKQQPGQGQGDIAQEGYYRQQNQHNQDEAKEKPQKHAALRILGFSSRLLSSAKLP